jgi:23S rRNA pseudouridine1911/1915/1917 synthase
MSFFIHTVTPEQDNERIDKLLVELNPDRSRSQVQTWIKENYVSVNGEEIKPNYKCKVDDEIKWSIPEVKPLELEPENIPLDILYEDRDLLVVNKPKGMVVHPSAGHGTGTLVHALLYHCEDLSGINGVERPGIVHRLDKDTSGLLLVAKHDQAHQHLSDQFAEKKVERKYVALVHGEIPHETGIIDAPIARDPKHRQRMAVVDSGKNAVTNFRVLKTFPDYSYIECSLETGRTHQIRVHMKYIEYPIVGDPLYGPRKTLDVNGQALHAKKLGCIHPRTKEWIEFESDLPEYFSDVLERIEKMY